MRGVKETSLRGKGDLFPKETYFIDGPTESLLRYLYSMMAGERVAAHGLDNGLFCARLLVPLEFFCRCLVLVAHALHQHVHGAERVE
jgi:hypothetical protein